jgi:hypothetical protein
MSKRSLITGGLILILAPFRLFAQYGNETITITTYYPSPYGVYRNLELYPSDEPTVDVREGVMYFNKNDHKLKIWSCIDQPACNNFGWVNVTDSSNPPGTSLYGAVHTEGDCRTEGGTPVPSDTGLQQCMFPATGISCPPGWTQYKSYFASDAQNSTCWTSSVCPCPPTGGTCHCWQSGGGGTWSCTATATFPAFVFGNNNPSQCASCSCPAGCGTCNCAASLTAYTYIGCY